MKMNQEKWRILCCFSVIERIGRRMKELDATFSCYHPEVDYFPVTACLWVFYSFYTTQQFVNDFNLLSLKEWHHVYLNALSTFLCIFCKSDLILSLLADHTLHHLACFILWSLRPVLIILFCWLVAPVPCFSNFHIWSRLHVLVNSHSSSSLALSGGLCCLTKPCKFLYSLLNFHMVSVM